MAGSCRVSATLMKTLGELAAIPGVRAALAATQSDGLPAASVASVGVDADALAAFATALFQRTRRANEAAGYGETRHLALDAQNGRVFVSSTGELALVLLADRDAGAGLLRVALQRALRDVS
jgi:predicted regulator of Ras-like GTPase activity (Roadblock/LC7/MglB family)